METHSQFGDRLFIDHYTQELDLFKELFSNFIGAPSDTVAAVRNTTEAMSIIANGFPFEPGDEIITYEHEYPANFYPWKRLEQDGVVVKQVKNVQNFSSIPDTMPGSWSWDEVESLVGKKTKFICLSHVQFVSGYRADLMKLGEFCKERNIFLVVDAAQSLGALPLDVEKYNISAMAGSGWKWMMGPVGSAFFYISKKLMQYVEPSVVGAESMRQSFDYLDHSWSLQPTAKKFEYSTSSIYSIAGLNVILKDIYSKLDMNDVAKHNEELQKIFLDQLNHRDFKPLIWPNRDFSSILSIYHPKPEAVVEELRQKNIMITTRGGYIRIAPHLYNTVEDMEALAEAINQYSATVY
ncbi:aminotransferase class V-fold PLP-dependent enzyme [Membranihabitans marinus]